MLSKHHASKPLPSQSSFTCPVCDSEEWRVTIVGEVDDPDGIYIECVECAEIGGWRLLKVFDA